MRLTYILGFDNNMGKIFVTEETKKNYSELDSNYQSQDLHSLQEEFKLTEEPKIDIPSNISIEGRKSDDYGMRLAQKRFLSPSSEEAIDANKDNFIKFPVVILLVNIKQSSSIRQSKEEQKAIDIMTNENYKEIVDAFLVDLSDKICTYISNEAERNSQEQFSIIVESHIHPIIEK